MCWAWVPPLEDDACNDEYLRAPVLRGAQHVLRHVLRHVLHVRCSKIHFEKKEKPTATLVATHTKTTGRLTHAHTHTDNGG